MGFRNELVYAIGPEPLRVRYVLGLVGSISGMLICGAFSDFLVPLFTFGGLACLCGIGYFAWNLVRFDSKRLKVSMDREMAWMESKIHERKYNDPHAGFGEVSERSLLPSKPKNPLMSNPLED